MAGSDKKTEQAQQQATSTNTIDPQQLAMLQGNYATAQTNAGKLATPYGGQLVAGFTPTQTQAQGILSGIATDPRYRAANDGAIAGAQGVLSGNYGGLITPKIVTPADISAPNFDPSQISLQAPLGFNSVTADPIKAGLLSGTDLSKYENPFTQDVISTTLSANERARQMAGVNDAQQATAAGAFGGSRSGVAKSLTNEAYDRNNLAALASLNSDNYNQAVTNATNDINRTFSADQFNSGQKLNADQFNSNGIFGANQFNANLGQAANIYNASNAQAGGIFNAQNAYDAAKTNQATNYNAGIFNATNDLNAQQNSFNNGLAAAGLKLNAAGQIVSLNGDALGTDATQAGILGSVGDQQQAQAQAELDAAYQAWLTGQQLTIQQQNLLNSALGLIPTQQTINSSGSSSGTTTISKSPGFTDILSSFGDLLHGASGFKMPGS